MDGMSNQAKYYHRVTKRNPAAMAKKRASAKAQRDARPRTNPQFWAERLIGVVKHRAKQDSVPFDLCAADIYVPQHCPIFGTLLVFGQKYHPDGASLDRLRPELGYVKGNVAVISRRANMIKQDATAAQVRLVAAWMEREGL